MAIPFSPLRTNRFILRHVLKPATRVAVGHCKALTHYACFVDDSLSASPAARPDRNPGAKIRFIWTASGSGCSFERLSTCDSWLDVG